MKTAPIQDVLRIVRAARRRLAVRIFVRALWRGGLLAGAGLVGLGAVNRWVLERPPVAWPIALFAVIAALAVALFVAVAGRKTLPQIAALLDRLGGTRDRFSTALAFARDEAPSPMRAMALRECVAFARSGDFRRLIPLHIPREAAWLLVPAVALAMLQWETRSTLATRFAETSAAKREVEDTAKKLEELARQTERAGTDEVEKIGEQLRRSAGQLRAQAVHPEEAAKSALRELSALEAMVQELQKPPGAVPEEMKEIAQALASQEATKEAAVALEAGDLAKAAEELEKARQHLAAQPDERTEQQIQQALEQALKRLAEQKQLSEALQKLARQMPRAPVEKGGQAGEAMRQLAQMLKQMPPGQRAPQNRGGQQNAATLQQVLAALQNMKYGEADGKPGGDPRPGDAQTPGLAAVPPATAPTANGEAILGEPSGSPGGEQDAGTTETPFGEMRHEPGQDATAKQLAGRLGAGESLSQFLPAAGDVSKSNRRYQELYEAMAPAAEDAAQQENIPLGSRFLIKRYFEAIRPKE